MGEMGLRHLFGPLALLVAVAACGGSDDGGLEVSDVRIGMPTGPNAALYFTVHDTGDHGDLLQGASTDVAASVELHETFVDDDGTTVMQAVDAQLEVAPGGQARLKPGGLHLMLVDVERLEVGDTVVVLLEWQTAGEMEVEAEVVAPEDTMEHETHDD
jgi:copper(I)-binding protein